MAPPFFKNVAPKVILEFILSNHLGHTATNDRAEKCSLAQCQKEAAMNFVD